MPLPRIACFHGGGSTAPIFKVQCGRLQGELKNDFEFVFFEGPFDCGAGPGVLPFFNEKTYAPYKSWFKSRESLDGSGYEETGKDGVERVWQLIRDAGPGGEWVGAMGFSQGSRIVGGLLLDQQLRAQAGFRNDIELKFGILCMGSGPPMVSEMSRGLPPFFCLCFLCENIEADDGRYALFWWRSGSDYDSDVSSSRVTGPESGEWQDTAVDVLRSEDFQVDGD